MNLQVYDSYDHCVFSDDGHWLHPLFALLDTLSERPVDVSEWRLCDKVIGRGAAVLIVKAGIRTAYGGLVSRRALPILEAHGVAVSWDELVDRIACMTEEAITPEMDLEKAAAWLYTRRREILSK